MRTRARKKNAQMRDRGECSSRSHRAEGQPLPAAAVTLAVLSTSTAATAANLIQDTPPPLTGTEKERERERAGGRREKEGARERWREGDSERGKTGMVGGVKRMLLSGAEQTRIVQGREAGAALTTKQQDSR